jgi:shikimate dehydrogenase
MPNVNGSTKLTGLIGSPLEHSVSPQMHNAAYEALGLNYCYVPLKTDPDDLEAVIDSIRALGFAGVNVTIPHKESVITHLDEVTQLARQIGAVNTVVNQNGRLIGYNTDGPGFIDSLREEAGFTAKGKNAVVIGAGGASKAIVTMLAQEGIKTLVISDIDQERSSELCEVINANFEIAPYAAPANSKELTKAIANCDILVNASPVGMHPNIKRTPIDLSCDIKKDAVVYDLVYNPLETELLKWAKSKGAKPVSGIGMLIRQGALSFTLFTEKEPPIEVMKKAALDYLKL